MSHISKIELEISDLDALKAACHRLGFEFMQGQKQFLWYSGLSECSHAIRVPGATYEIGVIKALEKYYLLWDRWSGGGLTQKIGENAGLIKQAYTIERVRSEARKRSLRVTETRHNDGLRLTLSA